MQVESTNARPILHRSTDSPRVKTENILTPGQVANRFLELSMYRNRPLLSNLSGLKLEYAIVQIYSKDAGQREANIGFHIGQGSQDIGFRNAIDILFNCLPSVSVIFNVKDDDGAPVMASFVISDGLERITDGEELPSDYRLRLARSEYNAPALAGFREKFSIPSPVKRLTGIYPLPSRRVAASDTYPDFFFHPQVYRTDGEHVLLPPGTYDITFTRGPEYIPQTKQIVVPPDVETFEVSFQLKRWIHMASLGWYSADHHVHAAGCSHYESPEEGVRPEHMWRQVLGEDLNVASVLTWGALLVPSENVLYGRGASSFYRTEHSALRCGGLGISLLSRRSCLPSPIRGRRLSGYVHYRRMAQLDLACFAMGKGTRRCRGICSLRMGIRASDPHRRSPQLCDA